MARKLPRRIDPANIRIGDVIRATSKSGDIEHSKLARVGSREYRGSERVYYSPEGHEIFTWVPGRKVYTVTLIKESDMLADTPLALFMEVKGNG